MQRYVALCLALLITACIYAEEAPGIKVGETAPELAGSKWFTKDGKAPELKGKVYLIDFWFAG